MNTDDSREDPLPSYNSTPGMKDTEAGATTTSASHTSRLLEPSLKLNYSTIENNLHKSDQAFAREVVKLIAERAENGVFARDCWGYKFLDPPVCRSDRTHSHPQHVSVSLLHSLSLAAPSFTYSPLNLYLPFISLML
jgi:hypothetical protein